MTSLFHPHDLGLNEIHVWKAVLEVSNSQREILCEVLSDEERIRFLSFFSRRDGNRWFVSRSALRYILAKYFGLHPNALNFTINKFGKPSVNNDFCSMIRFNLSHSRDLALIAVARHEIGIDVEFMDPQLQWQPLVKDALCEDEYRWLKAQPEELQLQTFFRLWTSKEAYTKGRGKGLTIPLTAFTVPLESTEENRTVIVNSVWSDGVPWWIHTLETDRDYAAALATPYFSPRIFQFEWMPDVDNLLLYGADARNGI